MHYNSFAPCSASPPCGLGTCVVKVAHDLPDFMVAVASDTRCWYQDFVTQNLVPRSCYQGLGTQSSLSGYQNLGSQNLDLGTRILDHQPSPARPTSPSSWTRIKSRTRIRSRTRFRYLFEENHGIDSEMGQSYLWPGGLLSKLDGAL